MHIIQPIQGCWKPVHCIPRISFGAIHIKPLRGFRKISMQNLVEVFFTESKSILFLKKNQHIKFIATISMEIKFAWRFEIDKIQNILKHFLENKNIPG